MGDRYLGVLMMILVVSGLTIAADRSAIRDSADRREPPQDVGPTAPTDGPGSRTRAGCRRVRARIAPGGREYSGMTRREAP